MCITLQELDTLPQELQLKWNVDTTLFPSADVLNNQEKLDERIQSKQFQSKWKAIFSILDVIENKFLIN